MFVLERDIVYERSTACARDVSCENFFPKILQNNLTTYVQGQPLVLKPEAQIINTVVQSHSLLETAGKLTKLARDREYPW